MLEMEGAAAWLVIVLVVWVASMVAANEIGKRKGRQSDWVWGLLLTWLGVLVVLLMPSRAAATKPCPDCAETVLADARVCRYCGYRFDEGRGTTEGKAVPPEAMELIRRGEDEGLSHDQINAELRRAGFGTWSVARRAKVSDVTAQR